MESKSYASPKQPKNNKQVTTWYFQPHFFIIDLNKSQKTLSKKLLRT